MAIVLKVVPRANSHNISFVYNSVAPKLISHATSL